MQETSKNKVTRYRCDHCKKLIPVRNERKMIEVDGRVLLAFEDRWYHFCNKKQWDKAFNSVYQLGFVLDDAPV